MQLQKSINYPDWAVAAGKWNWAPEELITTAAGRNSVPPRSRVLPGIPAESTN